MTIVVLLGIAGVIIAALIDMSILQSVIAPPAEMAGTNNPPPVQNTAAGRPDQKSGTAPALAAASSAPRKLNPEAEEELITVASSFQKITVTCLKGDTEGLAFATQIKEFLAAKGLNVEGVGQVTRSEPTVGQYAIEKGETIELLIGTNP